MTDDDPSPWAHLHPRVAALPSERRACFALACAERLVSLERSHREHELRAALADGWAVLAGEKRDLRTSQSQLESCDDADDDEVAAVAYALAAVAQDGSTDATLWAARRALDAAYERVPHPEGATSFRPLAYDTAEPVVQEEPRWQARVLSILESPADLIEVSQTLRS